jgi:exosortase/archaeosortase family protein
LPTQRRVTQSSSNRDIGATGSGYASIAGAVLHCFDRSVQVACQDTSGRYWLRIVKTCDAMDVQILMFSAVAALPLRLSRRLVAASIIVGVVFVVNVFRICSLYYIGIYLPSSFELVHIELWPALILIIGVVSFVVVAGKARSAEASALAPS